MAARAIAAPGDPWEGGVWSPSVIQWPHVPVSAANLPDGRIITWSGSDRLTWPTDEQTYSATWNPASPGNFQEIFHPGHNMFCAHLAMMKDGRVFVNGGRNQTNSPWTSIFNYQTNQWTKIQNMASGGRWYPTTVALPNGDIFTAMGTATQPRYPDIWNPTTGWKVQNGIDFNDMVLDDFGGSHSESLWWPLLHVAPNGQIFHSGPTPDMHWIDPKGGVGNIGAYSPAVPQAGSDPTNWYYKHGITIMYEQGKLLTAGGWTSGGNHASSDKAFTIDINGTAPLVKLTGSMANRRKFHNAVMLPTGEVLVIGGNTSGSKFSDTGPIYATEIWNPATGLWRTGASMSIPRNYHSVALLLTDGRVLAGGGGYCSGSQFCGNGTNPLYGATHPDAEIYSPPYLYQTNGTLAPRPVISAAPAQITSGQDFAVQATPNLQKFSLIKMSSTTHGLNTDVRFLNVPFTEVPVGSGSYQLTANANPNVLTGGFWMLFALNNSGVPSVAHVLQANSGNLPSILAIADQRSALGEQVSLQVVATDGDNDPLTYSATGLPAGLTIGSSSGLISGTISSDGSYQVSVTANDNGDGTDSKNFTWDVFGAGTGAVRRDWWSGIAGTAVSNLTGSANYPDSPTGTELLTAFEGPVDSADNYGSRIHGFLEADVSGNHTFWISSDDNGELWLSTDTDPANKTLIASVPGWSGSRQWTKYPQQQSLPVALQAGERYFIEALQKEGGGGDNLAVAWAKPGSSVPQVIPGENLSLQPMAAVSLPDSVIAGTLANVGSDWITVTLPRSYASMVVVATPQYDENALPAVTRIRNAANNQFDIRVQNPSNAPLSGYSVQYVVVEEGIYNDGSIVMEARKYLSTVTDEDSLWLGEAVSYQQNYVSPVVVGQVMTANDANWSVFWAMGNRRRDPPSSSAFWIGKHVGEDPITSRANETLGFIVLEAGSGILGNVGYEAGVGPGIVEGVTESAAPWIYSLTGSFDTAVLSTAGVVNQNGGWPLLYGADPLAGTSVALALDEDQVVDSERNSRTENVAYIAFSGEVTIPVQIDPVVPVPAVHGSVVSYNVTANTADLLYSFSFGDGTPATAFTNNPNAQHTYAGPGRYTVIITVQDPNTSDVYTQTFTQLIHNPLTANSPASSSSIVVHPGRDQVWSVNPDNDTVTVIDTGSTTVLAEIPVGDQPVAVAVAANGSVWVTNKTSSTISVIDSAALTPINTLVLTSFGRPHGIVMSPTSSTAYVVLEATGEVLKLNAVTGTEQGRQYVGPNPRHLSVSADGSNIYVSRFISAPLPNESSASPIVQNGAIYYGGDVVVLDANSLGIQNSVVLRHSDRQASEHTGPGIPNYLGPAVISPDGLSAWVPSKQDNILGGALRGGEGMTFDQTVRAISSKIDLLAAAEYFPARIDHDNASIASNAAFDRYGAFLFTALEGNREVAVSDVYTSVELLRFDAGRAPQGLALSADGNTLYVQNFMDRTIGVYDVSDVTQVTGTTVVALASVPSVSNESLAPQVLLGKQLFYDARDDRLALDSYMSCASCHNDGSQDGRVWDLTGLGEGLRNTIALEGRAGTGHGFAHWSANFDEIHDFEAQIRSLGGGTGLMSDTDFFAGTRSQPLGDPKAGISSDLDALAAYAASLVTFADSPYRNADGTLTPDGELGLLVFESENCASCHTLPRFTDSTDASTLHDVGTITANSGNRLAGPLTGIDTPTLIGVWQSAPYLHDGSAMDVTEAVQAHASISLTTEELNHLGAYLEQLDGVTRSISNVAPPSPVKFGSVSTNQLNGATWHTVSFDQPFPVSPIVVMGPPSFNDAEPTTVRVRNVTAAGFEFQLDEWQYQDGVHGTEVIAWFAAEPGVHDLGGLAIEAGARPDTNHNWGPPQTLSAGFASIPVILSQVVTTNEATATAPRVRSVTTTEFRAKLNEEDAQDGTHLGETLHFVAFQPGDGFVDGRPFRVGFAGRINGNWSTATFGASYTAPVLFANMQEHRGATVVVVRYRSLLPSQFDVTIQEETSVDPDTSHPGNEVGWVVISNP